MTINEFRTFVASKNLRGCLFHNHNIRGPRGSRLRRIIGFERACFTYNIWVIGVTWKPWISWLKLGMVALSAIRSGWVTVKNVELIWMRWAHLKNMLKNSYLFEKISKNFNQQVAQISLFQMRYSSPLSSRKWISDSPKCGAHLHEASTTQKYG